jgi:hypothetical protein
MLKRTIAVVVAVLVAITLLGVEAPGALADPVPAAVTETHTELHWYGWEILATDVAAVVVPLVVDPHLDSDYTLPAIAGLWAVGSPAVHLFNGNPGRALISFGMRVVPPVAGFLIGTRSAECEGPGSGDFCGLREGLLGFAIGAAAAEVVDIAILPYRSDREPVHAHADDQIGWALLPTLSNRTVGASFLVGF